MTSLRHNRSDAGAYRTPRDAYLDAARACILEVGWRRTTLTEVARRSGVSRMTIYRAWPDMPALLADLMTREWTGIVQASVTDRPLVESMVAAARALRGNQLFVRIVQLDAELILPYLLERRGRSQDLILELLTAAISAGQATGEIRAGSPVLIARSLVLAAHGFVLSTHTMTDDEIDESDLDAELHLLLERSLRP